MAEYPSIAAYGDAGREPPADTPETPEARAQRIIQGAKDCVQRWQDAMGDNIQEGLIDIDYEAGEQWPTQIAADRESESRPCLSFNKIFVKQNQIRNDFKQNPPAVEVHPASAQAQPTTARILQEMLRLIVYSSTGEEAIKVAFDSATTVGWGFVRVRADYVDDTSFDQEIVLDALPHTFNVCFDPQSLAVDGKDAKYCVILTQMT